MARYLALDWDHGLLHVVEANVSNGAVRVVRAQSWQEGQNPNPAEAEAQGKLLRERLKSAKIAPAPVVLCVGRDRLIVKEVRFPPVPDADEPALVRFQTVKELTDPPETVVIDYLPSEEGSTPRERLANVLVLRRELYNAFQTLCKAAGLKLVGVTPRPFGTLACFKHVAGTTVMTPPPDPPTATVAVVTVSEKWAEFCVIRGETLVLTRSLTVGPNLANEIRRNLAVYAGQAGQHPVRSVYVAGGGEHAALRERLQDTLGVPVHMLDPFGGAENPHVPPTNRGAFAGTVGLLHLQAQKRGLPVNFAKPRQPRPPRNPNRRRLVVGVAVAAAVLLAVVGYCWAQLAAADTRLEALYIEKSNLERQVAMFEEDAKKIKALEEWRASEIDWLNELYDLTDRFPDPNTMRLVGLVADPLTRTAKGKHVARMTLTVITTNDTEPVNVLMSKLVEDGHYRVSGKTPSRNAGVERQLFTQQFVVPVDVEKIPPGKYVRQLSVAPPQPREQPQGFGFPMPEMGGDQ